ncbi:MAG: metal-dependent transcriptional regulator [Candidatus Omnitrophota bacterium]
MKLTDRAEEILEKLWTEIVEEGKTPDTGVLVDVACFKELVDKGYVSMKDRKLLTAKGREEGKLCVRRHRLSERLLADVFQIKGAHVHEAGCKLEHILKEGLEDKICTLLGHPRKCPHGSTIPPGKCCGKGEKELKSIILSLSEMKKGQKGKIAYIQTNDKPMLRKIMAMGALPGSHVKLIERFPSYVFQIGESQFAVDKNAASQINVWV